MLLSTLTTVRNGNRYYDRFFSALLEMSDLGITHVVVDDNLYPSSKLQNYCSRNSVHYVRGHKFGRAEALNLGLDFIMRGHAVIWDIDDVIGQEYFEILPTLPMRPKNLISIFPRNDIADAKLHTGGGTENYTQFDLSKLFYKNVISHTGLCFDVVEVRTILKGYNEDISICVDYDLLMRSYRRGFTLSRIHLPNCLYADANVSSAFKVGKYKSYVFAKFRVDRENVQNPIDVFYSIISLTKVILRPIMLPIISIFRN